MRIDSTAVQEREKRAAPATPSHVTDTDAETQRKGCALAIAGKKEKGTTASITNELALLQCGASEAARI